MSSGLRNKVATGVAWMVFARFGVRVLGLCSTLVLVRLLTPADFGIVAMAMVVAAGLEILTMFSFDMALVQTKDIRREHYDSAWSLNMLLGIGLAAVLALLALPVSAFYKEPRMVPVMLVLSVKYLLDFAANPRTVDFRRNLEFRPDFALQIGPKVASVLVTIPAALWFEDYRALLLGMLSGSVIGLVLGYAMRPYRPHWCLTEAAGLFRFSRWLLLNNVVNFLRTRSADLVIGRVLGASSLGLYAIAYEVANLPSTEMVAPINRVLFPSYVQLAGDPERLRGAFRSSLGLLTLVILPVCVGLAALAEPLVKVLLGAKWLEAIDLIRLFALAGAAMVLQATTGSVYNALGKPRYIALTAGLHASTLIPMILYGATQHGVLGVAWAVLIHSYCIAMGMTYALFVWSTPVRWSDAAQACWRQVIGAVALFAALWPLLDALGPTDGFLGNLARLIAGTVAGGAVYLVVVFGLWALLGRPVSAESNLIQMVSERLRRSPA
jgi:lipopolysaccharide exporter